MLEFRASTAGVQTSLVKEQRYLGLLLAAVALASSPVRRRAIDFVIRSKVVVRRYEVQPTILTAIYHTTAASLTLNLSALAYSAACFQCSWTPADNGNYYCCCCCCAAI